MRIIKALGGTLIAVAIITQANSVDALQTKIQTRANGKAAFAEWFSQEGDVFTDTFLAADQNRTGTMVFYGTCTFSEPIEETIVCWSGQGTFPNSVFSISRQLTMATLSPVTLDIFDDQGNNDTVTIAADWEGISTLLRGTTSFHSREGGFMANYHENTTRRDAVATATVDSHDLGPSSFAGMVQYRFGELILEQ